MGSAFPKTDWIWRDGQFIRWEDAQLHVMSHVVHYGSSVFEGIRSYKTDRGAAVFRLREHLRRFIESARIFRMDLGFSVEEFRTATHELLERNGLEECYIRPVAFRSIGSAGLNPKKCPLEVHLICWSWGAYLDKTEGVDVCVSSWARPHPNTFPTLAKAGGTYLNSQLMTMEATANGYDEAIGLSPDGLLSEGSGQNLFLVREGVLMTPEAEGTILPGITRDSILTLAREMDIPVVQGPLPRERLYTADEIFLAGTASEVAPVASVDRIPVGDGSIGPITKQIQERYLATVRGEYPDVHGWLDRAPERAPQRA